MIPQTEKGHTNKNAHKLSWLTDVLLGTCPNSSYTFATDKVVGKVDIRALCSFRAHVLGLMSLASRMSGVSLTTQLCALTDLGTAVR